MILITGASGLLGVNLIRAAIDRNYTVGGIYGTHPVHIPGVCVRQLDLKNADNVRDLVDKWRPEKIIHCAAATNVDWCEENPDEALQVNADASRSLAEAAAVVAARMIYISTDSVYDGRTGRYDERDCPAPLNAYSRSKLAGEEAVLDIQPDSIIIRTNMYGWNAQYKFSLAEWILHRLKNGKEVPGFVDVIFSPLLVNDLSELLLDLMNEASEGVYHLASRDSCTKFEFARMLAEEFEYDVAGVKPVSAESVAFKARRPRNTTLATAKVHRTLGQPLPDVRSGLRRFKALRTSGFAASLKSHLLIDDDAHTNDR